MAKIHPTAIVEDGAQLGADVEIGPYAHIGKDVKIGDGTFVRQGAIIDGHTTIGSMCQIFPYALIGMKTQDLKYKGGKPRFARSLIAVLIGAVIMAHGDNNGLVLPPRIAPIQLVVVPVAQHKPGVLEGAQALCDRLAAAGYRCKG